MDLNHTAIWVRDLEDSTAFYEDVLGLSHQWDFVLDGVTNYYVGTADGAKLQLKHDPEDARPIETAGFDHLAFDVDDVDATFRRVVDASGCEVVTEPTDVPEAGRRVAYVADPDGYHVEFVQPLG